MRNARGTIGDNYSYTRSNPIGSGYNDLLITINAVLETGSNTRTSIHVPAITTQNTPIAIYAVFCTGDPEKMGPDEIFNNKSFPRAAYTVPEDFSGAQDINADIATSTFVKGETYKVVIIVQYAWAENVKECTDFAL